MSTGKTSKYLKYAIGEIILVVIGILIALQINNWNEQRKLMISEQMYLLKLNNDVAEMHDKYTFYLSKSEARLKTAYEGLLQAHDCSNTPKQQLDSTLLFHQALPHFFSIDDTYNEMMSANILANLSNSKLKASITNLYTNLKSANEYVVYFREDLGRASSIIWKKVSFSRNSQNQLTVNYNIKDLCQDIEFKNALVEVADSREDYVNSALDIFEDIKSLKTMLELEITKN